MTLPLPPMALARNGGCAASAWWRWPGCGKGRVGRGNGRNRARRKSPSRSRPPPCPPGRGRQASPGNRRASTPQARPPPAPGRDGRSEIRGRRRDRGDRPSPYERNNAVRRQARLPTRQWRLRALARPAVARRSPSRRSIGWTGPSSASLRGRRRGPCRSRGAGTAAATPSAARWRHGRLFSPPR